MEIEAKFSLPDKPTHDQLLKLDKIGAYPLSPIQVKKVKDIYLDTPEGKLFSHGYACRMRKQREGLLISLKSLITAKGPIHRREEVEIAIDKESPPNDWPESQLRAKVLELIDNEPLNPIFQLQQERTIRFARAVDGDVVAEISLDNVFMEDNGRQISFFELEVELIKQGSENDLESIVASLEQDWQLVPMKQSKFERALRFFDQSNALSTLLTKDEQHHLIQIRTREDLYGRRALALLALNDGDTQKAASVKSGLSPRRVRYWLAAFRQKRLEVFPSHVRVGFEAIKPHPTSEVEALPVSKPVKLKKPPKKPGLKPADSMVEAAQKTLRLHFLRMLYHEPGTRLGEDIEELHDMRVATRRMRAAFRVFDDFIDMEIAAPSLKGLRRTGRALGAVRDLDVFWEKTGGFLETLSPEGQTDLGLLHTVWKAQRQSAREQMLTFLDSGRYQRFIVEFEALLNQSSAWRQPEFSLKKGPKPHFLHHVVPVAIFQRLAEVLAYNEWVTGTNVPMERLHRLRITAKGLRYTMEYFREVLDPQVESLIDEVKDLQDHLGDLQDAVVSNQILQDFLIWGSWGPTQADKTVRPIEPIVAPGVAAYLMAKQTELRTLVETFPKIWSRIHNPKFIEAVSTITVIV
jgi:CHAD domain-containing protein